MSTSVLLGSDGTAIAVESDSTTPRTTLTGSDGTIVEVRSPQINPPTGVLIPVPGPPGRDGGAFSGAAWLFGEGPPTTIIGSKPGDYYTDLDDGTIYRLGD
jgi:hypothetical protein